MLGRTPMKTRSTAASRDSRTAPGSTRNEIDGSQHCKVCKDDDNTRMVQCDKCDDWYHFECVEVSQGVADRDWHCPSCLQAAKGAKKKSTVKEATVVPSVSTLASINPSIRVTSVPLNVVPQISSSLPALPSDVNDSMLTHVPSNVMFPPMSANKVSNTIPPSNTPVTSTFSASNILIPPSIFTLAGGTAPLNPPPPPSNQFIQSTACSLNTFPEMRSLRQCLPVSSGHPPILAAASIPLASSTIIPTTGVLVGQLPNEPLKSTSDIPQNNAKQGFRETSSQHSGTSRRSTKQRQLELELKMLDEERKLQEEENAKKREYLRRRYALLLEMASESSSIVESEDARVEDRVEEWVNNGIIEGQQPDQPGPTRELLELNTAVQQPSRNVRQHDNHDDIPSLVNNSRQATSLHRPRVIATSVGRRNYDIPSNQPSHGFSNQRMLSNIMPHRPNINVQQDQRSRYVHSPAPGRSLRPDAFDDDEGNNLTRSQVAARQAVSRELPTFSGVPEEWPLFFSSFTTTTNMCGYTADENLVRLQKCLTGKAFEAVKCMLMHPMNVTQIISTLKMRFGNPEIIVHNLMAKISSTPAPKADKLDTIIEFALAVQNLCATIEACQLEEYSFNVALLRELVDKLPAAIKLDWARYRRNFSTVNLSIFSSWLYELAEDICPLAGLPADTKGQRAAKNNQVFLNAHAENVDSEPRKQNPGIQVQPKPTDETCIVCKSNCPSVDKCQRFDELGYNAKWAVVKEFGLCRKCLKNHKGTCKSQKVCGKNGCEYKHHQLLHNNQRDAAATVTSEAKSNASGDLHKPDNQNPSASECNIHHQISNKTLFRVIPVILYGPQKSIRTFTFLDDGSSYTLMDATLANDLEIEGKREPLCLKWTGNMGRLENESTKLNVQISGTWTNQRKYWLQGVHTVSALDLFHQSVDARELANQYEHLRGIPIESYQNAQPRLLIGIKNANLSYPLKGREGKINEPIATKTRLGWVLHGGSDEDDLLLAYHGIQVCPCREKEDIFLEHALKDYLSLEGLGVTKPDKPLLSREDQRALEILNKVVQTDD
ncbi:uncharacterized protein LOC134284974 [Aedes albopictus]|uniref:PHD-type domain-containing protein n=1 Tax=Aedes albopictus TaxID=7160 RepID=A0ABM1ZK73_AEDAL